MWWRVVILVAAGGLLGGCVGRAGVGGTGELVVAQQRLREIEPVNLEGLSATRPTTQPATRPATPPAVPAEKVNLTLAEVRQLALENNLDLRVELFNPAIAQQAITEEQAQFESVFNSTVSTGRTDRPTFDRQGNITGSQSDFTSSNTGVTLPLRTGGAVRIGAPLERVNREGEPSYYTNGLDASISQPLLRGAGTYVNTQGIRVAFYQYQQSEARTKLEVIRVLANAERIYWRLYAARRELEVRKKDYDLASEQLARAQRQVRAGTAAQVDVVRAESAVADRLSAIITAENQVRDRQRELKRTLNKPGLEMGTPTIVVPETQPQLVFYNLDPDRTMSVALDQRMEMLEVELQIAQEASNVRVARNGTLPLVNVNYSYGINGLGLTRSDAFDLLGERDFEDQAVGLTVEVPIGNEAARSRLRQSLARRLQAIASKEQRSLTIRQEVLDAIDQHEASWQQIWAAQQRVVLAARLVEQEIRRFDVGLSTTLDVLDAQARLADAQSSEIAAVTEYQIALVDLAFATGTLLGASQVVWEPIPVPKG